MRHVPNACLLLALSAGVMSGCTMMSNPGPRPDYLVFFAERSAALDDVATQVVAKAAAQAGAAPATTVTVYGFTDSAGSPQADVVLSQQRAARVAEALIADGVPASHILRQGRGQTHDDPGVESRRVEIVVAP